MTGLAIQILRFHILATLIIINMNKSLNRRHNFGSETCFAFRNFNAFFHLFSDFCSEKVILGRNQVI